MCSLMLACGDADESVATRIYSGCWQKEMKRVVIELHALFDQDF
jgi:hypothetical protein